MTKIRITDGPLAGKLRATAGSLRQAGPVSVVNAAVAKRLGMESRIQLIASLPLIIPHTGPTAASGTVSASSEYEGWQAWRAVDGSANDPAWSNSDPATVLGAWWMYVFPVAKTVTSWNIRVRSNQQNAPRQFRLQSSSDGVAWTTHFTRNTNESWLGSQTRSYSIGGPVPRTHWRFINDTNPGHGYVDIAEIQLFGY